MAAFCLLPEAINKFKDGLIKGEIDPAKLTEMTSEQRHELFGKYVGTDNAKQVNALFESKLLLKNQKAGYIAWAKKVGGITEPAKRDLISRIEKMDTFLNPVDEKSFLHDLASQKLGTQVTAPEAKSIFDLSQKIQELQKQQDPKTLEFPNETTRLEYGANKIALLNYVSDLKNQAKSLTIPERLQPKNYLQNASDIAGVAKALKASFDDSAIFRQGWKTLWTNPRIWRRNAALTFSDFTKTLKSGEKVIDGIMADIISRPTYDKIVQAKLDIGKLEEAFPTALPAKVPFFGRIYLASETAYTGFVYRMRADVFDSYLKIAEKSGIDTTDIKQLQGIGQVVNSLTGRGNLGRLEPVAGVINNVFFSPRLLKSNIDLLTAHAFDKNITSFARKQAATNLVKVIIGTAAVLIIARAINPNSVEIDPRSSDFGKIKIGDTRFDMSGGMASILTLVSRLIPTSHNGQLGLWSKSSSSGKITNLLSGAYGQSTGVDVIDNFFQNKLSPAASIIKDIYQGKDFNGNKPTIGNELNNLLTPLPITNYNELSSDPHAAPLLLGLLADALGISANTYGQNQTNWNQSTSKALQQFKSKVSTSDFTSANNKFNTDYNTWAQKTMRDPNYQNLNDSQKTSVIEAAKATIEKKVLRSYHFTYLEDMKTRLQNKRALSQFQPR